ncbi:two-component sensor histidine kinase [Christensenellaceae bacterium]|nr:two-component sensor histidine kinase [Christensenellaceae bacterium]BDF62168.1 two-component sensor histidine kinase [Christensenellaceae bacterium]
MKFAWKVFLSTIMVIAVVFAIGGYVLITSSFDSALQRETERALEENQLMKLAYESAAIPYEGTKLTDEAVTIIASQLENGGRRGIVLSDENYKTVFSSFGGEDAEQELLKSTDEGRSYTIGEYSGEYWIAVSCKSIAGGRTMYLETSRDISDIFMQRTEQFRTYIKISIVLLLAAAGVMWLVSMFLTRPLRKLSATTRRIAQGNYSERMKVMSNDEIGDFTRDFNLMTDAVEDKIYDLENAARQKEDFVASFAHELKTPLTSIIGYADMLRSRNMTPEEMFMASSYIFTEGKRLEALSLKLLELMVLNRSEFEKKRVNPRILIEELNGLMRPVMEKAGMELKVAAQNAIVVLEPDLFKTLLVNLIDNAKKASEPGSAIELYGKIDGRDYVFCVKDHGRGIPPEEIRKITEAFYMVDKSRARAQNGAGLGLALADKIASLHGTRLEFKSIVGTGTIVCVRVRRARRPKRV